MSLLGKQSGPKLFVRLSKVSALEDVRLRQVLLYNIGEVVLDAII